VRSSFNALVIVGVGLCLGLGCTTVFQGSSGYSFFARPDAADAWSPKIEAWQQREEVDDGIALTGRVASDTTGVDSPTEARPANQPVASELSGVDDEVGVEGLRAKYFRFRADRRRETAAEFVGWIQGQAREHYVADGAIDHWATFEETLRENGDDCDGLELLVYHGLRDLGFGENEVYRAIVYRPSDGQHHMVTLWFEDPEDPWVLDPTGAMTTAMLLMSELPSWVPLKLFSETAEYTVRRERVPPAKLASTGR
jgi:hypothetical protein